MGVGTVADLLAAVDGGCDLFDCVYPTRCGRNGRAMTRAGELNLFNAAFTRDYGTLDEGCDCYTLYHVSPAPTSRIFSARKRCWGRACSHTTTCIC